MLKQKSEPQIVRQQLTTGSPHRSPLEQVRRALAPALTCRRLLSSDESRFQALLKAVYGETYSYQEFYQTNGYGSLIDSKKIEGFGIFLNQDFLISHAALLLKDPKMEYAEIGIALRNPSSRVHSRQDEQTFFRWLLTSSQTRFSFLHQNITTYHPLAQRFAIENLNAVATGLIVQYTQEERLNAIEHRKDPMHALTMTTILTGKSTHSQKIILPSNAWGKWLSEVYDRLNIKRDLTFIDVEMEIPQLPIKLTLIEENPAIKLRRRHLQISSEPTPLESIRPIHRTELIHLSLNPLLPIHACFQMLMNEGYYPVGIRPHYERPDEAIFQYLGSTRQERIQGLASSRFALPSDAKWIETWRVLIS